MSLRHIAHKESSVEMLTVPIRDAIPPSTMQRLYEIYAGLPKDSDAHRTRRVQLARIRHQRLKAALGVS